MKSLIYIGMDVHKESYFLATYLVKTNEIIGEAKLEAKPKLIKTYIEEITNVLLERGYDELEFITCYEAGCLGFSLYKELIYLGINCKIVAPTTLTKSNDSNVKKNDRRDALMLARNLAYGTCSFVHIPDDIDLETREYIRMRTTHKKALKKIKQVILAFILRCGKKYDGDTYWTIRHIKWLYDLELSESLKLILDEYLDTYNKLIDKLERLDEKILNISNSSRYKEDTDKLNCLKGITKQSALTIISEIGDFKRFGTPNELCSYLGLVPGERSSAGKGPRLGITKLGNKVVRTQLVESAQALIKGAPGYKSKRLRTKQQGQNIKVISYCDRASERLMHRYRHLIFSGLHHNKAITAIARELACFIWGIMNNKLDERVIGG